MDHIGQFECGAINVGKLLLLTWRLRFNSLCQRSPKDKFSIRKMRVPVKVVINRVIDPLIGFALIGHIERGDPEVIEKRSEIRARSEEAVSQAAAKECSCEMSRPV